MAREIPKSITRGPSSASSTFDGFRSRCTTPAAWIAARPSASPAASVENEPAGSGQRASTVPARGALTLEPVSEPGLARELRADHLDRDETATDRTSQVYLAHAAGPQPP